MGTPLRPLIAGNWKMNGVGSALEEIARLKTLLEEAGDVAADVLICPPATLLDRAAKVTEGSAIALGGQDCHAQPAGAHTGDISAPMLADAGAGYVILGHSERRADHGETSAIVREKAGAALSAGLTPVICVGETQAQRDAGETNQVVAAQIAQSLPVYEDKAPIVIAYEPVWAIGTGKTATPDDIAIMHAHIRALLVTSCGPDGEQARILYGGSVKPANAAETLRTPHVNGALVGGASLLADDFFSIIVAA